MSATPAELRLIAEFDQAYAESADRLDLLIHGMREMRTNPGRSDRTAVIEMVAELGAIDPEALAAYLAVALDRLAGLDPD